MTRGLVGFLIAAVCVLGLLGVGVAAVFVSLPDVQTMKKCITTEMYHVHLCETDQSFTPLSQISPYIIGAVVMSEDAAFYSHHGVDLDEMKESAIKDFNEGRFARGGSTITQQLAKNVFLTKDKNLLRKAEEVYLAYQIEKHFNKSKILTYYLNVVEFGEDIYGVKAACRHYFNKTPMEVTPEQAAFLAFLLPNPKKYSQSFRKLQLTPFANKMVKTILHKMALGHKITEDEYQSAIARVAYFPWRGGGAPSGMSPEDSLTNVSAPPGGEVEDKSIPDPVFENESDQNDNDFKFDFTPEENL